MSNPGTIPAPGARRYQWCFHARWWQCVGGSLDMKACRGALPGIFAEQWSYVELWETEDTCIATTSAEAQAHFTSLYPWIEVYHISLLGEIIPVTPKKNRRKKAISTPTNLKPAVETLTFEVVPERTMSWKCLQCREVFQGPVNRSPKGGCPGCGSSSVIDINVGLAPRGLA